MEQTYVNYVDNTISNEYIWGHDLCAVHKVIAILYRDGEFCPVHCFQLSTICEFGAVADCAVDN